MSGKRLIDLAALFNASRGVAQKHIALRNRQIDVYSRTSTLARAVQNQTERVTETAKAASFLVSRLNEKAPAWESEAEEAKPSPQWHDDPIPSRESTKAGSTTKEPRSGLDQDHFYEKSAANSAYDEQPKEDLHISQEQASRYPLPDGTIPAEKSNINTHELDHEVISTRPTKEPPKYPLQGEGLRPAASGASTIPLPTTNQLSSNAARTLQRQSELQIPSKSADALGESAPDPLEAGHDEDSFYRKSGHTSPTLSSLPRVKIPKHPSDIQEGDNHLQGGPLNSDSYYSATKSQDSKAIPALEAVPEQDQVPEGINTDLFYSPRIAKLLGGNIQGGKKPALEARSSVGTPIERTTLAEGRDQDTFNVRTTTSRPHPLAPKPTSTPIQNSDSPPVHKDDDIENLVQEISEATAAHSSKVS